jgi:hypothetical protein
VFFIMAVVPFVKRWIAPATRERASPRGGTLGAAPLVLRGDPATIQRRFRERPITGHTARDSPGATPRDERHGPIAGHDTRNPPDRP